MIKELLISEVRVKILKLLILNPDKSYHVRAIVRLVGAEINAVRRELENLTSINLLRRRQSSNKIYYTADTSHIFYSDLLSMLAKEEGLGSLILKHIREFGEVSFAVISKAFLRGRVSSRLDVDLFIVGNVKMDKVETVVKEFQQSTGKEINYSVMNDDEFLHRKRSNDQFLVRFMTQGRAMLFGDEEKFSSVM